MDYPPAFLICTSKNGALCLIPKRVKYNIALTPALIGIIESQNQAKTDRRIYLKRSTIPRCMDAEALSWVFCGKFGKVQLWSPQTREQRIRHGAGILMQPLAIANELAYGPMIHKSRTIIYLKLLTTSSSTHHIKFKQLRLLRDDNLKTTSNTTQPQCQLQHCKAHSSS